MPTWFANLHPSMQYTLIALAVTSVGYAGRAWVLWLIRKNHWTDPKATHYREAGEQAAAKPAAKPARTAPLFTFDKKFGIGLAVAMGILAVVLAVWRYDHRKNAWGPCTDTGGLNKLQDDIECHPGADIVVRPQGSAEETRIVWACYCRNRPGVSRAPNE